MKRFFVAMLLWYVSSAAGASAVGSPLTIEISQEQQAAASDHDIIVNAAIRNNSSNNQSVAFAVCPGFPNLMRDRQEVVVKQLDRCRGVKENMVDTKILKPGEIFETQIPLHVNMSGQDTVAFRLGFIPDLMEDQVVWSNPLTIGYASSVNLPLTIEIQPQQQAISKNQDVMANLTIRNNGSDDQSVHYAACPGYPDLTSDNPQVIVKQWARCQGVNKNPIRYKTLKPGETYAATIPLHVTAPSPQIVTFRLGFRPFLMKEDIIWSDKVSLKITQFENYMPDGL